MLPNYCARSPCYQITTENVEVIWFEIRIRTSEKSRTNLLQGTISASKYADVVGIFPNEGVIVRLVGAMRLEQNDEWSLQRR